MRPVLIILALLPLAHGCGGPDVWEGNYSAAITRQNRCTTPDPGAAPKINAITLNPASGNAKATAKVILPSGDTCLLERTPSDFNIETLTLAGNCAKLLGGPTASSGTGDIFRSGMDNKLHLTLTWTLENGTPAQCTAQDIWILSSLAVI